MKRARTAMVQTPVRMREHLRAKLATAAASSGRSLNSEIIKRLEQSFDREGFLNDLRSVVTGGK